MKIRAKIFNKFNGQCAYCGVSVAYKMQIDHIKPKCFGGTDHPDNLNPSCRSCNNYKLNYTIEEFRAALKKLFSDEVEYLFKSAGKRRLAVQFKAVTMQEWDGLFYFETLNMETATECNNL